MTVADCVFRPVGSLAPNTVLTLYCIWFSNVLVLNVPDEDYYRNVPDEDYPRNASCALNLISTFFFFFFFFFLQKSMKHPLP